ncbi:MAG: TraR/DksA family transcriptional regulator [Microlunatus sp.]|nr:TraR/DksA family transcriptional regulator [Microlunatus sp.]MDN5770418.1 TraR/DksA family transcriptional regulator [Microlunatus sp.]
MNHNIHAIRSEISATVGERDLSGVRAELDQQRRFRVEQLDVLKADAAEAVATGDEPRRQVTQELRLAAQSALTEIDAALERLEGSSYGTCERCHESIPPERLEVLPTARLCTHCQFRTENGRSRGGRPARTPSAGRSGQRAWVGS